MHKCPGVSSTSIGTNKNNKKNAKKKDGTVRMELHVRTMPKRVNANIVHILDVSFHWTDRVESFETLD